MTEYRVCFITAPNQEAAVTLAKIVLQERLAACVNIIPQIRSLYWWQGDICDDAEVMLVVKTNQAHLAQLTETIAANHSYQVCEVLALPVLDGNPPYLNWLGQELAASKGATGTTGEHQS